MSRYVITGSSGGSIGTRLGGSTWQSLSPDLVAMIDPLDCPEET